MTTPISANSFRTIVGKLFKFSVHKKEIKAETIWIFKILQIQKRIVPAETIHGNMVGMVAP